MATSNPTGPSDAGHLTTYHGDEREQRAVLRQALELRPDVLTKDELIRELTCSESDGFSVDAVDRAVRDLVGTGLLHRLGEDEMVRPTRAAIRYFELSEGAS